MLSDINSYLSLKMGTFDTYAKTNVHQGIANIFKFWLYIKLMFKHITKFCYAFNNVFKVKYITQQYFHIHVSTLCA